VEPVAEGQWRAARRLIERGAIGPVVWSQGSYNSQTTAAWNNLSASEVRRPVMAHELDWHAFLGDAPPRAFSAERYAAWWKYWDYSGGIASEVFYAKLAPLLVATGAAFPERVSAAGGVYVQDGREVPDTFVMNAEYPEGHTIVLASSMAQAQDLPAVIRGRDGSLELTSNGLRVVPETPSEATTVAVAPAPGLIDNWLACMRTREACVCDVELGYRTMVAIGMAVDAYRGHKTLYFDAIQEAVLASPPRSLPTRTFEDRLDALDAETALREFRASGEQSVPYEEGRKKAHLA
jgi:predicted dehydrogenase